MADKIPKTIKKSKHSFTFIDLFAGIGGFHLAFNDAGAKCVFASEWDMHARNTYQTNFGKKEPELFKSGNYAGDITKVDPKTIPDFDILTAGFPCQPFSHAGFKKGFADPRGTLFYDIVKILEEKKPSAFFLENVSHLYKHDNGVTFATIKKTLEDMGYTFKEKIVRASDFGLPQHRARLFMIGFNKKKVGDIDFEFPEPIKRKLTMSHIFGGKAEKDIGYTLRVGGRGSGIHDRRNWDAYIVDGKVVRLTPKEGKKLMGFPNSYKFPVSDGQALKQLGNAVAVPAIRAVAVRIIEYLNGEYPTNK